MKKTKVMCLIICFCMLLLLISCDETAESESSALSEEAESTVGDENVSCSEYQNSKGEYIAKTSGKRYDGQTITFLTCGEKLISESEIVEIFKPTRTVPIAPIRKSSTTTFVSVRKRLSVSLA